MIYEHQGKWVLREGKTMRLFKTEQEAAKAAGLDLQWEVDHGVEEEKVCEEENTTEKKAHYSWLKEEKSSTKK